MRGHIRQRGKGIWAIVVDVGRHLDTGKRLQEWIKVKGTKRDAERILPEILQKLETGSFLKPSRLTVSEYLTQWMQDCVAITVGARTARGYGTIVKRIKRSSLAQIKLTALKPAHVQRYHPELIRENLSAQTVKHHHALLHGAMGQALK